MSSSWRRRNVLSITAMALLCSCGGKNDSNQMNTGAAQAGTTASGDMGTSGSGALPASGSGGLGGASAGSTNAGGVNAAGTNAAGTNAGGTSAGGTSAGGTSAGGSSNQGGSSTTGSGTVTEAWSDYCVATFSSDYDVRDDFDKLVFTVHAGERYLIAAYPATFGGPSSADLFYMTPDGPFGFKVDPGTNPSPFTTDCPKSMSKRYYAVFADVSLYSDGALTTKLCDLTAGTALPLDGSYGYSLSSVSSGQAIYSIILGPYAAQCGGSEQGFLTIPTVQVLGQSTYVPPIRAIVGPP